jgi:hypothetical protein
MSDDVNFPSDETLFEILRISQRDIEKIPASAEELRLARALVPPPRLRHDGRIEHAVALLASAMGRMPQYNPTHLPFGYQGPIIKSSGWLDRDDLDLVAKQIVGLTWIDSKPDDVACVVGQAISNAINLSLLEQTDYDAWRPGMRSGSGWREAVCATAYGVAKAKSLGERQIPVAGETAVSGQAVKQPVPANEAASQPKSQGGCAPDQAKQAMLTSPAKELISKKTRIEFREFLVGWTLREISDEFDAADIVPDKDFVPDVNGQRRSLVEQYYHALNFTCPADVQKLVKAYENILTSAMNKAAGFESGDYPDPSRAKQLRQAVNSLSAWLKKDGYAFENGAIAPIDTVVKQQDEPEVRTISEVTRRDIFDALRMDNVQWAGRLSDIKFLSRLYDLEAMPPDEPRFNSAEEEIWQYRVNNPSVWPDDWVFTDSRFGLANGPDETFRRFLCEMLHPLVQPDKEVVDSLVAMFNKHLAADGWEIVRCREISNKPVFSSQRIHQKTPTSAVQAHATALGGAAPSAGVADDKPEPDAAAEPQAEPLCEPFDSPDESRWKELFADPLVLRQREALWQRELGMHAPMSMEEMAAIENGLPIPILEDIRSRVWELSDMTDSLYYEDDMLITAIKYNREAATEAETLGEAPRASSGMAAWMQAEKERIRQEDYGPYMTPPPNTEPRDVRVLWIENAARDLAECFARTLAERTRWWAKIEDADKAQNPADREVACHEVGKINRMLQAQKRLAGRVFNQAVILLPVQATADAEIIRNLPNQSGMTPEQVRQATREWNRIADAAVRDRNATTQAAQAGQDVAADAENWVFEDLPDGEVRARNRRVCERYGALNLEDLLLLCHQWHQMAIRFTAATKKAGKYHGHVVHDEKVQEVTKILETAMVSRKIDGTNRLSRCLRRPDNGHLHNALAALDDLEARLRLETCESGVLEPAGTVEDEAAGSDPKPPKTVQLQAPPQECYGEIDVRSADKGFLRVLFYRKNTDGRPTAACDPIPVEGQLLAILVAGRDMALKKLREAEDELPDGELADDYKTILEWTQDSVRDHVKGDAAAGRQAINRLRRLVKFQGGAGLVTNQDRAGTWRSVVSFCLRKSDKL